MQEKGNTSADPLDGLVWYRYVDRHRESMHQELVHYALHSVAIEEQVFIVLKRTSKGVWLERWFGPLPDAARILEMQAAYPASSHIHAAPRFVLSAARRRLAHPTKEGAMAAFVARKQRQIAILRGQLARAEVALRLGLVATGQEETEPLSDEMLGALG